MFTVPVLVCILFSASSLTIVEPVDGTAYTGDWLSIRAIVENENVVPDSVVSILNGDPTVQIPRQNTDWSTYMANDSRTGYSLSPAPYTPEVLWKSPVSGIDHSFANPIIVNGIIYHMSENPAEITALNSATGEILWNFDLTGGVDDGPTYYQGKLYPFG